MSRLLGPLSETISSVSERASALAGDQIAGAAMPEPAVSAVTEADFRKLRRSITGPLELFEGDISRAVPESRIWLRKSYSALKFNQNFMWRCDRTTPRAGPGNAQ